MTIAVKSAVASGPVRRFVVGDPAIQFIDALAGATLDQLAATEHQTRRGEVVLSPESVAALAGDVTISEWRGGDEGGRRYGVVSKLAKYADPMPWPDLPQALTDAQAKSWLLAPIYERTIRGDVYLAELRTAVALFVRFGHIDYDHDPMAGQKLDAYIRWAQGVVPVMGDFCWS